MEDAYFSECEDIGYVVLFITTAGEEDGMKISSALVDKQLVACVNMIEGVTSVFRWKGKVEKEKECLLIVKTAASMMGEVIEEVKKLHEYDVPEIIALPIVDGNPSYLKWIDEVTASSR